MKKAILFIIAAAAAFNILPCGDVSAISAQAYVLYFPASGEIIASSNAEMRMSMASTTKIMTGLLLCSQPDMSKTVKVTSKMLMVEGTSAGLCAGDEISLYELCYGMMLESGNDAANCAAYAISGSIPKFAELMNQTAIKIGMKNTNFVTPSGLDSEQHYTTAYDMALLAAAAMQNATFREIVGTKSHRAVYNGGDTVRTYSNHNRLLRSLDGCTGIKTGFTKKSGRCLVSSCKRDGTELIMVTLNAPDDWNDHISAYESAFCRLKTVSAENAQTEVSIPVCGGDNAKITANSEPFEFKVPQSSSAQLSVKLNLPRFLYPSVRVGDTVGYAEYYLNGIKIAQIPFTATDKSDIIVTEQSLTEIFFRNILRILNV